MSDNVLTLTEAYARFGESKCRHDRTGYRVWLSVATVDALWCPVVDPTTRKVVGYARYPVNGSTVTHHVETN